MRSTFLEEIDLQTTVMGVREELMKYFKGSCGQSVARASNVQLRNLDLPRARYQYQRLEQERQRSVALYISDTPVLKLQKHPNTITLIDDVLTRSPQMLYLKTELEDFLQKYLGGVTIKRRGREQLGDIDDGHRFEQQRVNESRPEPMSPEITHEMLSSEINAVIRQEAIPQEGWISNAPF